MNDYDGHGALWARVPSRQGNGHPEFARVHTLRQRRVMRGLRCQVCAGPADRTAEGVLWLLHDDREESPGWPEGVTATQPPVCPACASVSVRLCPRLGAGFVAVRVRNPELYGVYGVLYRGGCRVPEPECSVIMPYGAPALPWVLASQLVRRLEGCTFVDLADEGGSRPQRHEQAKGRNHDALHQKVHQVNVRTEARGQLQSGEGGGR